MQFKELAQSEGGQNLNRNKTAKKSSKITYQSIRNNSLDESIYFKDNLQNFSCLIVKTEKTKINKL